MKNKICKQWEKTSYFDILMCNETLILVHFDFWFSINTVFLDLVCLMKPKTLLIV